MQTCSSCGHKYPESTDSVWYCPNCGLAHARTGLSEREHARAVKPFMVKLIEDYNVGLGVLTKGMRGQVIQETDYEYFVNFSDVVGSWGGAPSFQQFWIPKKSVKKFSLLDHIF